MGSDSASDAGSPVQVARTLLDLTLSRPETLGEGRLVSLDGPAGSGKTTLAAALAEAAEDAGLSVRVVHMDDLYDGWQGLPRVGDQLGSLLEPLGRCAAGEYRRYDWIADRYAEAVTVAPVDLLVLEGVGSGDGRFAALRTVLVWVQAPDGLRLERGLDRDGHEAEPMWRRGMVDEAAHFEADDTRARADLLVDGTGERAPTLPGGGAVLG